MYPCNFLLKGIAFLQKRKVFLALLILFSFLLLLLFNCSISSKPNIAQTLRSISSEDKYFLEVFFRSLVSHECGSYVFFGDKPASFMLFHDWQKFDPKALYKARSLRCFSPAKRGFEIWQKHQHLFPLRTYALLKTRAFFSDYAETVFLIHKKRLLHTLTQNFTDFHEVFPQFESASDLKNAILTDPAILQQICVSDLLLGIILGFGRDNAVLFARKKEIESFLYPQDYNWSKSYFGKQSIKAWQNLPTLEKELNSIEAKEGEVIVHDDSSGIEWALHYPAGFLVDTTKTDLHQLRSHLKQIRVNATQAYQKGNFLEVTLQVLTQ